MSLFDDIIQRGFDEMAKAKRKRDEIAQDIVDGDYVELDGEDVEIENPLGKESDEFDENHSSDEDQKETSVRNDGAGEDTVESEEKGDSEPVVPEESATEQPEESVPQEPVTNPSDTVRQTVVSADIRGVDKLPDDKKSRLLAIAGMPESTLDEVTAKAITVVQFENADAKPDMSEMGIWASHLALQQFHERYDKDAGRAWKINESEHPLVGWSDVVARSLEDGSYDGNLVHSVDMKKFGLPDNVSKSESESEVEQPKGPELPDFLKDAKWNEKIYGKGDKSYVFLGGKKHELTDEERAAAKSYLREKKAFEKAQGEALKDGEEKLFEKDGGERFEEKPKEPEEKSEEPYVPQSKKPTIVEDDHDWADGYSDMFGGYRTMNDNGMISYEGVLGKFEYDSTQFQLQVIQVDPDEFGNPATSYPVLKYIGPEVDGKYIQIPEGLQDASFMFDGNKQLQSMPKLPSSLKTGFGMFKDCSNLESARAITLPTKMTDAQFMFSGCSKLVVGPAVIPGSVKDATGMFANCKSLGSTPKLMHGIECCDSMFANCESLTKKPSLPHSVQYADYATYGCDGIDAAERQAAKKATAKQEKKFEKALDKKTFGDRLGSVLSACMQVHAMRKSGANMFHAMFMAHQLRKVGAFSRDMAGGWSALYKVDKSGFNQFMMMASKNNNQARQKRESTRRMEQTDAFANTNSETKQSSKQDRTMYANGFRAMKSNYFEKVAKHGYPAQKTNREAVMMDANELGALMESREQSGSLNAKAKTYYSKKALELVSNQVAYYKGAESAMGKDVSKQAVAGLHKVSDTNMKILADKIQSLQEDYQFMNDRQFKSICELMEQTSYGKTDSYKEFKQLITADMKSRVKSTTVDMADNLNAYRRKDYQQAHGVRGNEAEKRFGFVDNQSVHAQPGNGPQYEG